MGSDTYLCPDCGWTGSESELDRSEGGHSCPVCRASIRVEE
jgi:DNA-directed RNA polymerase subunit RPC12/RpoP